MNKKIKISVALLIVVSLLLTSEAVYFLYKKHHKLSDLEIKKEVAKINLNYSQNILNSKNIKKTIENDTQYCIKLSDFMGAKENCKNFEMTTVDNIKIKKGLFNYIVE